MTPLPPVPNCIRADMHFTIGPDTTALVRTHWLYSGSAPSAANLINLAGDFRTACTAMDGLCSTQVTLGPFVLTDIASNTGAQGENTSTFVGTRSGAAMTAGVAANVAFLIAQRYRGGKPKGFFPFGVDADLGNLQSWSSAFISSVNTAMGTWQSDFITSSAGSTTITNQCAVSYFSGYNPPVLLPSGKAKQSLKLRTGGPVTYTITGLACQARVGSQRKRLKR